MNLQKQEAERYQELFDFFAKNHNLILTASEMDDIVFAVLTWKEVKG